MNSKKLKKVDAIEFGCKIPLRFYEHCSSCPRFDGCPDLDLIREVLRLNKNVNYDRDFYSARGEIEGSKYSIDANVFTCLAPLRYFEKTRTKCAREGRCREEGLLLTLLTGKRELDYSQEAPDEMHRSKPLFDKVEQREPDDEEAADF
ncbi:MAG TPA: hypothetical protein VMW42_09825 [Desulfatiglandales bacterium]|nr:hypothetical protein [Desulfatiglandales bacterium]